MDTVELLSQVAKWKNSVNNQLYNIMQKIYIYGEEVPQPIIDEALEEGVHPEDLVNYLETLYYYEFLDCVK